MREKKIKKYIYNDINIPINLGLSPIRNDQDLNYLFTVADIINSDGVVRIM